MSASPAHPGRQHLDPATAEWLEEAAHGLDTGTEPPAAILPALAQGGLTRVGIPQSIGGTGGDLTDAVTAIAEVSSLSLAAGFVLWGHRTYTEYLLQSDNVGLRERLLPELVAGRIAGATGLSNAMKFLAGLEELQITARAEEADLVLDGKLPWVTNLRPEGFHVAAAVSHENGSALIVSLPSNAPGVARSPDLDLFALRASNTAAITISNTRLTADDVISNEAHAWLKQVRPAFLGMQCGMSIGLARRALHEASAAAGAGRHVLAHPIAELTASLAVEERALFEGLKNHRFLADPASLFRIRIVLAEITEAAVGLELQASGGRAYLAGPGKSFARRWREAAFIPVVTPSLVQLKTALAAAKTSAPAIESALA
ncbi:acyl-CoA dehydrogenase family protein [Hyphomicrobium sp. LHD-15]|uniref:acyl-CoA dehydrogenase family protein n=1 Tax=Hyphomicrobium sp. LHD-15 TaxID=3072142 RepID=UPI00280E8A22|nr:acyl-CoA dehydrogenase family protein [Hyphomicrobium sp. LHD-15]MDQ8699189.1 acyl-CoA dehydrogenase family protein [Hyphomicrobium sp. LHD-15]